MAKTLSEYLKGRKARGFVSKPHYFRDGDFVTYFLADEDHFAERVDELLTIYRSTQDRGRLVGCKVKGVRRIVKRLGEFEVRILNDKGDVLLGPLFLGSLALARNPSVTDETDRRKRYEEIRRAAKDALLEKGELQFT